MQRHVKIAVIVSGLVGTGPVAATTYSYVPIAYPGALNTYVTGLNTAGVVVGQYQEAGGTLTQHGFIFDHGVFQNIEPPGAITSGLTAISDNGTAVGFYETTVVGAVYAFAYKAGVFTTFGQPGLNTTLPAISESGLAVGSTRNPSLYPTQLFAYREGRGERSLGSTMNSCDVIGVNDVGIVIGSCSSPRQREYRPVVLQSGHASIVRIPEGHISYLTGINNSGVIAGIYFDSSVDASRGFTKKGDVVTVIADPMRERTVVYGINNSGDTVGVGYDPPTFNPAQNAFSMHAGVISYLEPLMPNCTTYATAINAAGQVLGYCDTHQTPVISFLATPQP